jgi:TIR domain
MTSPWLSLSFMASPRIFISYRRDDSGGHAAGRVTDRLEREFGRDLLFIDVDSIPPGRNFVDVLREEVAKCGVLIAVIGPDWLDAHDKDGNRRLDNPNDFVRIEIATALQRKEYPRNPNLARRLKDSKGRSIARGSQRAFVTQQP